MTSLPKTMKSWRVIRNGVPSHALELKTDIPVPAAAALTGNNILVRISHAALNPVDLHFMNVLPPWLPFRYHPIPAFDFAGEVVAAGPAVGADFKVGTRVCAAMATKQVTFGKGALAEYVVVPADMVAVVPEGLSLLKAAGLGGIAGQTAVFVEQTAGVQEGWRVLVNGASGGVGSLLVQIVKAKGANVFAVCSEANADMVKRLGADEVIAYDTHDPVEGYLAEAFKEQQLDLILDCAGTSEIYTNSPKYLTPRGRFLTIVGGHSQGIMPTIKYRLRPVILGGTPREYQLLALFPSGEIARQVAKYVTEGAIKEAPVDSEYPMEEAVKAYEKLAGKHAKGKIVIKVAA